jgi:hypothetical protein
VVTPEQLADEAVRARKVRHLVDLATSLIMQASMSRTDAEQLMAQVRDRILALFPGAEETYEVVYARRFKRLIDEYAKPDRDARGIVLPFRPRPS